MEAFAIKSGNAGLSVLEVPLVLSFNLRDDGAIPNNWLPLLLYQRAFRFPKIDPAGAVEELFEENTWGDAWRDGIYDYHHYHSTAHEVLAICQGWARVQFGGEQGTAQIVQAGDVIVIPAGVAHKNLGSSPDLLVVGAYPRGQEPDLLRGEPGEHARALASIARVPRPEADPIYGPLGPLLQQWGQPLQAEPGLGSGSEPEAEPEAKVEREKEPGLQNGSKTWPRPRAEAKPVEKRPTRAGKAKSPSRK